MDKKEIRRLIKLMVDNDLSELDVTEGENRVHLKRAGGEAPAVSAPSVPASEAAATPAEQKPAEPEGEELIEIKSPMVGTFFAASSPDSDAYVSRGAEVAEDSVVCIVEAMKVMNEIKAECVGDVAEICVKNAQPVEFGQVLFRVRPA
ncbi:MAG: acetyl-CoA carboxylase biotin carboxyl carrier protein [Planctomycetota bacterium]|nr:acetyl-CoA carboxylase biotin carboxyl carrier protein [Planctomycetota bacterium]